MWLLDDEVPMYNYRMTMMAVVIAKDGIAIISDGRMVDFTRKRIISDNVDKMFELPGGNAYGFAGGVTNSLAEFVAGIRTFVNYTQLTSIDEVADLVRHSVKDRAENDYTLASNWLRDKSIETGAIMMFAGYDAENKPAIRLLVAGDEWKKSGTPPKPYCAIGTGMDAANKILNHDFVVSSPLKKVNLLAMRALINAEKECPESVGGQAQVWNILPSKKIKRLSPRSIAKLRKKATTQ